MGSFRVLSEAQERQAAAPRWVSPAHSREQSQTVPRAEVTSAQCSLLHSTTGAL